MKVAFLTTRQEKPSYRYRVEQFLPYLRAHGVTCDTFFIPAAGVKRWRLFRSLDSYDVVFLQKKLLRLLDLFVLRSAARKLIYDVDDALMYKERDSRVVLSVRRRRRLRATVRMSDLVLAGNDFLCSWAANYARDVFCFRTVVDTERYRPVNRGENAPLVIGWSGSRSTNGYLNMVLPALAGLSGQYSIKLCMVSDTREGIDMGLCGGMETEFCKWDSSTEVGRLQSFDVGLMPLPDNEWTRGKCALKALLYMACGVPAVCSALGAVRDIITDGDNGILVEQEGEWHEKIERLLKDGPLRRRVTENGRETVVKLHSVAVAAPRLLTILQSFC